uniref:Anion exchange protein n=1 Tax=Saccoglossus kowalevskii TaxID=10224 RepID=A0ABM0GSX8_SACKO|nr:PREDICTED: anion exchange protein 2-like [Saccoglossus kowalevskii]
MPLRGKKKSKSSVTEMETVPSTPDSSIPRVSSDVTEKVAAEQELSPPPWRRASFDGDIMKMLTPKNSFIADIAMDEASGGSHHYYDERDYQLHRRSSYHHHSAFGHHRRSSGRSLSRAGSKTPSFYVTPSQKSLQRGVTPKSSSKSLTRSVPEEDEIDGAAAEKPKFTLGGEPLNHDKILERDQSVESELGDRKDSAVLDNEPGVSGVHSVDAKPEIKDIKSDTEEEEKTKDGSGEDDNDDNKVAKEDDDDVAKRKEAEQEEANDELLELESLDVMTPRIKHKRKHRRRHKRHYKVPEVVLSQEGEMHEDGRDPDAEFLIASHRLENVPGMRRHLIRRVSSVMHPGRRREHLFPPEEKEPFKSAFNFGLKLKKKYDHQPHEVFVELDELYKNTDGQMAWKEKARWIKFEEDVEEGADRWGKPHVASMSFHSLLELRRGLEQGTVLLDLDERDISGISYQIVEQMIVSDQIKEEERGDVLRALLMQHRYVNIGGFIHIKETPGLFRTLSSSSLPSLKISTSDSAKNLEKNFSFGRLRNNKSHYETKIDIDGKIVNHVEVSSPLLASPLRGSTANNNLSDTNTASQQDILDAINEFLDESIVLPPGDWNRDTLLPIARVHRKKMKWKQMLKEREENASRNSKHPDNIDPLKRTGCLFGGMVNDIRRRFPRYSSDFKDAFNLQSFAAVIFIYFAALSPAITFGGLLGEKTDKWMGVSEMVVGTAVCGVIFALFSAQPLHIIGATGPVLIFEEAVYQFCETSNIEFLPFRAWIGIWVFLVTVIVVAFEGSTLVRYFTRFTEEIFTALVSLIFIFEVFKKLALIFETHPLLDDYCWDEDYMYDNIYNTTNHTTTLTESYENAVTAPSNISIPMVPIQDIAKPVNQPNTALLSTILTLGTFFIAYFFRKFRNSRFLSNMVRKMLQDFGVLIAIVTMVLVDVSIKNVYTQKLEVPDGITPTAPQKRGWFINPFGLQTTIQTWVIFAALIPALLVFILLYMETLITELIVGKKENNLKKGTGYHLNLFLIGLLVVGSSMFGLPWLCCATVRSVSHTTSLTVLSKTHAPGEKPKIEGVIEQRVTALFVNILIGVSLALQDVLRQVPIAVLFGVFLYMGVTSLSGIQFFERMQMLLQPAKHHPDVRYVRKVRTYRIHLFTLLQLVCLALLWVVKSTVVALAFPFVLVLMVPVRLKVLARIFTPIELDAIDNDEGEDDDDDDLDVYRRVHMPL